MVAAGQNERSDADESTDKKSLYHRKQVASKSENALHDNDRTTNTTVERANEAPQTNFTGERLGFLTKLGHHPRQKNRRNVPSQKPGKTKSRSEVHNSTHRSGLRAIQLSLIESMYSNLTVNNTVPKLRWWRPLDWCEGLTSTFFAFDENTGDLRILRSGLYYIYAQITFKNAAALNKYEVKVNETKTIFSCTQERLFPPVSRSISVRENCHAGTVTWLQANQNLSVWNSYVNYRPMDLESQATFWGLMRIGSLQ